jgi:hypothetical protein
MKQKFLLAFMIAIIFIGSLELSNAISNIVAFIMLCFVAQILIVTKYATSI